MHPTVLRPAAATAWRHAALRSSSCARCFSVSARAASPARDDSQDIPPGRDAVDVAELLSRPTWSVASLLSESKDGGPDESSSVTLAQLRHLLRLSALPFPTSPEDQAASLDTLRTQLRFVRDVQSVDTAGLTPLHAIRDETREGLREHTVGVKQVEQTLLQEESFGHNRRPRRRKAAVDASGVEDWDVLGPASQTAGRYIVVKGADQ